MDKIYMIAATWLFHNEWALDHSGCMTMEQFWENLSVLEKGLVEAMANKIIDEYLIYRMTKNGKVGVING